MKEKNTASFPVAPPVDGGSADKSSSLHRGAAIAVGLGSGVGRYAWNGTAAHGTAPGGIATPAETPGGVVAGGWLPAIALHETTPISAGIAALAARARLVWTDTLATPWDSERWLLPDGYGSLAVFAAAVSSGDACAAAFPSQNACRPPAAVPTLRALLTFAAQGTSSHAQTNRGTDIEFTRLKESDEYQRQRGALRSAELDLIDHVERVAALRRQLPADTVVDDYQLVDVASGDPVRLSQLCTAPDRALILYHFMYGKAQTEPCPMCTMWIDGYNAVAPHLAQNVDFAVVAAAEPAAIRAHAAARGWNNLRLLSAGDTSFKYDLGSEEADGTQTEWISVFTRSGDDTVRHIYSKGAQIADNRRERGIDLLTPVWNLLDLTPDGRDDWYPSLHY